MKSFVKNSLDCVKLTGKYKRRNKRLKKDLFNSIYIYITNIDESMRMDNLLDWNRCEIWWKCTNGPNSLHVRLREKNNFNDTKHRSCDDQITATL